MLATKFFPYSVVATSEKRSIIPEALETAIIAIKAKTADFIIKDDF